MTLKEITTKLSEMGYAVKYFVRKDGGIRITQIGNKKFTGSTGNIEARKMLGVSLTERQSLAMEKLAKSMRGAKHWGRKKLESIDEDAKKYIQKMQRLFRKQGVKSGKPTIKKYRENVRLYGKEEAQRKLKQTHRYVLGYAYVENVENLIMRLQMDSNEIGNPEKLEKLIKRIQRMKYSMKESILGDILDTSGPLYQWELGTLKFDDFIQNVNNILDNN